MIVVKSFAKFWSFRGDEWLDDGELTNEEKALIEQRLADHALNPERAVPWEQVKARLAQKFGQ